MSATPLLRLVLQAMQKHGLEAVLIGCLDKVAGHVDVSLPETAKNLSKLRALAKECGLLVWRPLQPAPFSFRLAPDDTPAPRSRSS